MNKSVWHAVAAADCRSSAGWLDFLFFPFVFHSFSTPALRAFTSYNNADQRDYPAFPTELRRVDIKATPSDKSGALKQDLMILDESVNRTDLNPHQPLHVLHHIRACMLPQHFDSRDNERYGFEGSSYTERIVTR